eukprot:CAMPEP_0179719698 /NCGR_PEP_ID=MMETSP0938-20121108/3563_1 /TAXON_ID=548131 ORGANISM="Ostreococcus mediterraneus, Strain clade-D-RCC1107" /NCGR_SAMPLE_ID=MMETSP0938 /ASSEMBLY_ACC=CAM_ASM_000576 /LENGTH=102 /DNA_ID=CAMNT_0021593549 /DNA_START=255 /DNA_END=563 /DNA_ORIENTATION=+
MKKNPNTYSVEWYVEWKYRTQTQCVAPNAASAPTKSTLAKSINGNRFNIRPYATCDAPDINSVINGMRSITNSNACMTNVTLIAQSNTFFVNRVYSSTISAK